MNTRRKFLLSGSMATTALLSARPFKSLAGMMQPLTGWQGNDNRMVLIHTADYNNINASSLIQEIKDIRNNTSNLLLLHAGLSNEAVTTKLRYDMACQEAECVSAGTRQYRILHKGDIRIGIITAITGKKDIVKNINSTAAYLKNEKKCQVVICLSQLGFKNKTSVDDMKLAARSSHLDIIIGGNPANYTAHPVVAQNSKKAEVIIHADSGNGFSFGNIEICFDDLKNKRSIAINALTARRTASV